ncbi:MAG: hypothetical protein GY820_30845 [Gammaproteobacteria bacterium]|nr:hypothetical protein [Gammaproteobacteria bacterium]
MAKPKTPQTKQSTRTNETARKRTNEIAALLDSTCLKALHHSCFNGSELAELSPDSCRGGRRTVIHKVKNEGVDISSELSLYDHAVLGADPESDEAIMLLGRLTRDLRNHHMTVDLMVDKQGVSGLLLKRHLCCEPTGKQVEESVDELDRIATCVEVDMRSPTEELELAAFPGLIAQVAEFTPSKEDSEPFIIPTFDSVQFSTMQARSDQLKR